MIDTRQAYLQDVVAEGLRALGHTKEAENSIHFDYEIVALTPRCAAEMGYELSPEDAKRPYVEVSGRKGFGVKADDLITRMLGAAEARSFTEACGHVRCGTETDGECAGCRRVAIFSFEGDAEHDHRV